MPFVIYLSEKNLRFIDTKSIEKLKYLSLNSGLSLPL